VLLAQGDVLGSSVWIRIRRAIDTLNRQAPREDEAVN
jgi:hypothetical protein